jgi:hypothetical protein
MVTFEGSEAERQLAEQIFMLARFQGRFFPATAPIRLTREALVGFLASQRDGADGDREALAMQVDAALRQNAAIFAREETDDGVVSFVTTRGGTPPALFQEDTSHTLAKRFMEPVALPPPPAAPPKKPAPMIAEGWSQRPVFPELLDEPEIGEVDVVESVAPTPGIPALEPATTPTGGEDVVVTATPTAADTIAPAPSSAGRAGRGACCRSACRRADVAGRFCNRAGARGPGGEAGKRRPIRLLRRPVFRRGYGRSLQSRRSAPGPRVHHRDE